MINANIEYFLISVIFTFHIDTIFGKVWWWISVCCYCWMFFNQIHSLLVWLWHFLFPNGLISLFHSAQTRDVFEMVLCREGHPVPLFVSICTMQVHCRKTGQMEWKDNGKLALASLWRGTRCSPELCSDRAGASI